MTLDPSPRTGRRLRIHQGGRVFWRVAMKGAIAVLMVLASPLERVGAGEGRWVEGITEPIHDVMLSLPVIGIVGARRVEEGAFVKQGQMLMELDKSLEQLEVSRRELARELSRTELERLQALSQKNAISVSREELEKKQTEFKIAAVELELAKEQLQRRLLVAPIDGTVTEIFLEVGEGCEPRQPALRLVDIRRCYFVANLEVILGRALKVGQKLKLQVPSGAAAVELDGEVSFVSPVVDPASGLMKVKLIFENPSGGIRPGVAGRILIAD